MRTECTPKQLEFPGVARQVVVASFDGGPISCDGGALLLREVERRTGIVRRVARRFVDHRDTELRAELNAKGLRRAQEFSWDKCARETLGVIRGVAKGGR